MTIDLYYSEVFLQKYVVGGSSNSLALIGVIYQSGSLQNGLYGLAIILPLIFTTEATKF